MLAASWFIGFLTLPGPAYYAHAQPEVDKRARLCSADFSRADSPTCGIQEAIDRLPEAGGVVVVPPGRYVLRQAIVLRSGVTLRGAGPATVLTRGPQVAANLIRAARKGESHVQVDSTQGFRPGDGAVLFDDAMHGWHAAHVVVKSVEPGVLEFEGPIGSGHREGLFRLDRNAVVVNYFPMVCAGTGAPSVPQHDLMIERLTIDGNAAENPGPWQDFTLAAIHLARATDSAVLECTIRHWISDGIGVQGGSDNRVEQCLVEHCRSHGFHPGTSLSGGIFARNIARHNAGDGLYFCCIVRGIAVTNNLFHGNRRSGIGGLGAGCNSSDSFNVVSNNVCRENGQYGIQVVGGKNNVVSNNVCFDNSQAAAGRYSGIVVADSQHTVLVGNRCGSDLEEPSQAFGIEETGDSDENVISANLCVGNARGGVTIVGKRTEARGNLGDTGPRE